MLCVWNAEFCEILQKKQDSSAMVRNVSLVQVYVEKNYKRSAVECKKHFVSTAPSGV